MALKILLADDSMTAQNMGKKILTEAGYEVVAVSNGAQAVKKIASEKPELAVLDVFMPGYTGVEVCERLRKAQETAHIPVLLTVGKMEPFKAEEGTRAGADGLVVKPFEASDLLAAVKKLEEKLVAAAPEPEIEATVKLPVEEFQDASYEEWKVSAPETPAEEVGAAAPAAIAVPDDMASTPFGMESLEETPPPPPPSMTDTQPIEPPPAARATEPITPPDLRPTEPITPPPEVLAEPAARTTAEMPAPLQAAAGAAAAPVLAEEAPAPAPEIEFTSQRVEHEVEHAPTPGFEPTISQEQISAPIGRDSLLVTDTEELSHFATKFGVEGAEPIPVGVAAEIPGLYADSQAPAAEAPAAVEASADADFEARVAAAMAGYEEAPTATIEVPAPEAPAAAAPPAPEPAPVEAAPEPPPVVEPEAPAEEHAGIGMETASFIAQMQKAVEDLPIDTTPHVEAAAEPVAVTPAAQAPAPAPENAPDHALAAAMAAAVGAAVEPQVVAAVAPAAESTQKIDPTLIADIVSRVVERMKPDLAAEIARELESKLRK